MGIPVKLEAFEGPLDLLLHLIEKNKVDIYDIPIAGITDQYMDYLNQMEQKDLDVMSEFLVMAATLLDIKAKMLLPPEMDEEGEELDPRAELVEKLLEYKMYRFMSMELRDKEADASFHMYRDAELPKEVLAYRQPVDLEELLQNVTLTRLNAVFQDILKRQEDRKDPIRSGFGTICRDEVDLGATMNYVRTYLKEHRRCTFRQMLSLQKSKMYTVVTFLTILELIKVGVVEVEQEGTFSEICINVKQDADLDMLETMEIE